MSGKPVRNRIGWRQRLAHIQGSSVDFNLGDFDAPLAGIRAQEADLERLANDDIEARAMGLRDRARAGEHLNELTVPFFDTARDRAARPRPASVRRPGPRGPRADDGARRRDADRRGEDARRRHAGGAPRAHRSRRRTS